MSETVSEAILVWSGYGLTAWPRRDELTVVERFGEDDALDLIPAVLRLVDEFYESDAHQRVGNLAEMGNVASDRFRSIHPEISSAAVDALAWCYTFDYK